jgi:hypothetical protein
MKKDVVFTVVNAGPFGAEAHALEAHALADLIQEFGGPRHGTSSNCSDGDTRRITPLACDPKALSPVLRYNTAIHGIIPQRPGEKRVGPLPSSL